MKKLVLLLLAVMMIVPSVEAKKRETPEEKERKTRHYSGWEWGAQGRFNLVFYNMDYTGVNGEAPVKRYYAGVKTESDKAMLGGSFSLNGGYFLNNHLKSRNYGMAGALSVYLFIVSGILCFITYRITNDTDPDGSKAAAKKKKKEERRARRNAGK